MEFLTFIFLILFLMAIARDIHPFIRKLFLKPLPPLKIDTENLKKRDLECLKDKEGETTVEKLSKKKKNFTPFFYIEK